MSPNKNKVKKMFDDISPRYDFLNHFLSFGIDRSWRKKVFQILREQKPRKILDVATGTGDLAFTLAGLKPEKIFAIDISSGMLEVAREKAARKKLGQLVEFKTADAEHIPFSDNQFDAVTVAFGVRNFEDLGKGIREIRRVVRPGGMAVILEFSQPEKGFFGFVYKAYSKFFIPLAGKWISKHDDAYSYLPETAASFPSGNKFLEIMKAGGFVNCRMKKLSFGIATVYTGKKGPGT